MLKNSKGQFQIPCSSRQFPKGINHHNVHTLDMVTQLLHKLMLFGNQVKKVH